MKKIFQIVVAVALLSSLFISCKKDENGSLSTPPLGLGGDTWFATSIDKWVYDSLTVPFNIAAKYRWDAWELALDKTLVPPDTSKVIDVLGGVKRVGLQPYIDQTGSPMLIKKYAPKNFVLVGSPEYNYNGTITLGQAEGGTKITLYLINYFTRLKKDSANFKQMLHTIHHEFGHILHQNVMFTTAYKNITGGYTATWFNVADADARKQGFITAYAMAAPEEDFVEMVSSMLIGASNGPTGYDNYDKLLTQAGSTTSAGYLAIKAKEAIVVDYFAKTWGIDFYGLQTKCRAALAGYLQ
ncbi:MAG: putative zinc-binding metallopeptidase [Sphingobacteriia bacterium]|nr:putative zinc-binding metallopeptidase [Sphingobacteriia bacterium]